MSEEEAVKTIEDALEGQLEGIDAEAIIRDQLNILEADYAATLRAQIIPTVEPTWEADFDSPGEDFGYHMCPSESDESDEDFQEQQLTHTQKPKEAMSQAHKEKILEVMSRVQLRAPVWLQHLPDKMLLAMFSKTLA